MQKGIQGNEILNNPETWHRCINYTLALANTEKDLTIPIKKNELINKISREANVTVISYLCDIKIFTNNQSVYDKVKDFYSYIYNLNINDIEENVEDFLKTFNKSSNLNQKKKSNNIKDKKKEKSIEEENKKKKEDIKEKENDIKNETQE